MKKYLLVLSLNLFVLQINAQDKTINGTTFKQGGEVGIGTSAPDSKLTIYISGGTTSYPTVSDKGNVVQKIRTANNGLEIGNSFGFNDRKSWILARHSDAHVYGKYYSVLHLQPDVGDKSQYRGVSIGYNASTTLPVGTHLAINGSVGIGTTSPNSRLHVKADDLGEIVNDQSVLTTIEGSVVGNNSKFQILNKRNDNGYNWNNTSLRLQRVVDATPQAFIDFGIEGESSNYGLAFGTRNGFSGTQQTRMVIEENGDVGIGTTNTKGFKLGVNGRIAANEIKVATYPNWPDYVFDNDYNLPTLKEVEQHIKENGHLKNIPSAKEVKKEGFFLGEMDSKLLQKIEELMLYTIQQEKENKVQNNKIEKLEKENQILKSLLKRVKKLEEKTKL